MTTRFTVEISLTALLDETTAESIEQLGFAVLDALVVAPGVIDADLLGNAATRTVTFSFLVEAPNDTTALARAAAAFDAAFEKAVKGDQSPTRLSVSANTREAELVC